MDGIDAALVETDGEGVVNPIAFMFFPYEPDFRPRLRAAMAAKPDRPAREPGTPRKPREGTKQEAVLNLLRREEGATVAQIAEATGWASHTVRGFLAGLKKKGVTIEVLERVRQVGPNRDGAKGSFSVYRAAG